MKLFTAWRKRDRQRQEDAGRKWERERRPGYIAVQRNHC